MRTRKEIEELTQHGSINEFYNSRVIIELLLDIRELIAQPTLHKDFGKLLDSLSTPQE